MFHKNCLGAIWNKSKKVIVILPCKKWARGLTKTLASCFYPNFSIKELFKHVKKVKKKTHGRLLGNNLDKLITRWTISKNKTSIVKFKKNKSFPWFEKFVQELKEKNLSPVKSQLSLGCSEIRLGTNLDVLCKHNQSNELVLIEIKYGFDNYYDLFIPSQRYMLPPFDNVEATFRNKHLMQLYYTKWLYEDCNAIDTVSKSFVVRLFGSSEDPSIEWVALCDDFINDSVHKEAMVVLTNTMYETTKCRKKRLKKGSRKVYTKKRKIK